MKSTYYMGQSIGKTRKDGSPFYVVNILALDRYGQLSVSPLFVTEPVYNDILNMKFEPGDAVTVSVSFNGVFQGIELNRCIAPLEFDKPATSAAQPGKH